MARPTPSEILDAIADVLETTAAAGIVVRDPVYCEDYTEYAEMLRDTSAVVDGWLVEFGPEEPESRSRPNGTEQISRFLVTGMLSVGTGSLAAFGAKVEEAKAAFRTGANEQLGFGSGACRQRFLYAPNGYQRVQLGTNLIHLAPMEITVWAQDC
jgi:hypothetical protein